MSFFEDLRSTQLSWVVMPNHVHALFLLHESYSLERLVASWKRTSARRVNVILGRAGTFWQKDYFDRFVRDETHFCNCVRYIRRNPGKANLSSGEYLLWESDLAKSIE